MCLRGTMYLIFILWISLRTYWSSWGCLCKGNQSWRSHWHRHWHKFYNLTWIYGPPTTMKPHQYIGWYRWVIRAESFRKYHLWKLGSPTLASHFGWRLSIWTTLSLWSGLIVFDSENNNLSKLCFPVGFEVLGQLLAWRSGWSVYNLQPISLLWRFFFSKMKAEC
jgi:hypothetical protein